MSATGIIDHVVRPHVAITEDKYLRQPAGAVESFLPTNMPSGVARVVNNILYVFEARTMAEHCRPMPLLSRDVVWDAPPFLLSRKGSVRVSSYFFKFFARQRFVPTHIEAKSVGFGSTLLEVSGTLEVYPRRTILIPASLLLPEMIPIRATLQIGVNGPLESGEVELVVAKWHNLPSLPNFVRAFNGTVYGNVPHLLEPIWSYLPEYIGDDFYRRRREATFSTRHPDSKVPLLDAAKDVVTDTASGVMDYGVSSVGNMRDGVGYIFSSFMEAAGFTVGRARAYTGAAANLAGQVAGTAFNTATNLAGTAVNVAGTAAGTAAGVATGAAHLAGTAANTALNVADQAAGTAANLAGSAAGTAANLAGQAAGTAANLAGTAAQKTIETASYAAGTAANVAGTAASTAANAASTAAQKTYDTTTYAAEKAANVAGQAAQKTYDTASYAAGTAADVASTAAQKTYDTAAGAANTAYDAGSRAANTAYDAGSRAANTAYDTTTTVASKTYDTGAAAANTAYETGREGARMGATAAERAAYTAQQAAEDAKRGYEMGKTKPVPVVDLAPGGAVVTTKRVA